MTTEDFDFEDTDETPDVFSDLDDVAFAELIAKRDAKRNGTTGADTPDDKPDPAKNAWDKSPWATYSPDDLDREIAANAAADTDTDDEQAPDPAAIEEASEEVFQALGRLGTGRGTGLDRKLVRDAGLLSLVAPEFQS